MRENKLAQRHIVSKAVYAVACGINEHRRGAEQNIARRHLLLAALHEVLDRRLGADGRDTAINGENGADGHIDIDVRRAVERVDGYHVLSLIISGENYPFFLLRNQGADLATVGQGAAETDVGNHVQFLLVFALYVLLTGLPAQVDESGAVDLAVDDFARQGDITQ